MAAHVSSDVKVAVMRANLFVQNSDLVSAASVYIAFEFALKVFSLKEREMTGSYFC